LIRRCRSVISRGGEHGGPFRSASPPKTEAPEFEGDHLRPVRYRERADATPSSDGGGTDETCAGTGSSVSASLCCATGGVAAARAGKNPWSRSGAGAQLNAASGAARRFHRKASSGSDGARQRRRRRKARSSAAPPRRRNMRRPLGERKASTRQRLIARVFAPSPPRAPQMLER
jgi:hypothetical protein